MFDEISEKVLGCRYTPRGDEWEAKDEDGFTIAHLWATRQKLSPGFQHLYLDDGFGVTPAHLAAYHGNLPDNFDRWHLKDQSGESVAHYAARGAGLPKAVVKDLKVLRLENQLGVTVNKILHEKHEKLLKEMKAKLERTRAIAKRIDGLDIKL